MEPSNLIKYWVEIPLYRSKLETIFFRSKFCENFAKKRGNKYWVKLVGDGAHHFQRFFFLACFVGAQQARTHRRSLGHELADKIEANGCLDLFLLWFFWFFLSARFLEPLREMEFAWQPGSSFACTRALARPNNSFLVCLSLFFFSFVFKTQFRNNFIIIIIIIIFFFFIIISGQRFESFEFWISSARKLFIWFVIIMFSKDSKGPLASATTDEDFQVNKKNPLFVS